METLHPMVVHFPIALLMAAWLIETLALLFQRSGWHKISLWNVGLGTLGALAAVLSGRQAMAAAKHSMEIYQVMELHERLGYVVLTLSATIAGWRLFKGDRLGRRSRWLLWGLLTCAVGLMAFSAYLGGRMVYEFGVGGSYGRSSGVEVVQ